MSTINFVVIVMAKIITEPMNTGTLTLPKLKDIRSSILLYTKIITLNWLTLGLDSVR